MGFKLDSNNVTCSPSGPEEAKNKVCPSGYDMDELESKCIDIDECKELAHDCKISQYCHNTIGGYHCLNVKAKDCPAGYQYDGELDECKGE